MSHNRPTAPLLTTALLPAALLNAALCQTTLATPMAASFTYQGQLTSAGQPANGTFTLVFTLWDSPGAGAPPSGGTQIGGPDTESATPVTAGLFTVQLNDTGQFGATAFNGDARWPQIAVDGTALGPRQPLTAAPYAHGLRLPLTETSAALGDSFAITKTSSNGAAGSFTTSGTGSAAVRATATSLAQAVDVTSAAGTALSAASTTGRAAVFSGPSGILFPTVSITSTSSSGAALYVDGNVGIGVLQPAFPLDLAGRIRVRQDVSSAGIWFYQNAPNEDRGFVGMRNDNQIGFYGSEGAAWGCVMDVDTGNVTVGAGNVSVAGGSLGIGTTAPETRLHILGGLDTSLAGGGFLTLGPLTGTNVSIDNNEIMARNNGTATALTLNNEGGNVYLIPGGSGSVGIGTNSPQFKLDVVGAIRPQSGVFFNGALGAHSAVQGGNVLSFGHPGTSEDQIIYRENTFIFWDSPGSGDTSHPELNAADFITISDIRLKTDIQPLQNSLAKVRQLRGIQYRFDPSKVDPQGQPRKSEPLRFGFAAQEVAVVVPEAVKHSEDLDVYGVSHGAIVPLLVEAIKDQQAQIEQLQARLARLESSR